MLKRVSWDYNDKSNDIVVKRGKDIISTIDIDLQLYIEKLLLNKVGSVVAIEPHLVKY